ncbi:MAG TPA: helix-turn-helix transcriptional regulator [Solirubrobacteraceae bacterium]|nr:helix-turn-helix transcriptional regulator [Solirubrobacteraceae bacterium]
MAWATAPSRLTDREREVLARVALGETGQTIARELSITGATVESHVRNILEKLGAKNRPHAVALALQSGELPMPPPSPQPAPGSAC